MTFFWTLLKSNESNNVDKSCDYIRHLKLFSHDDNNSTGISSRYVLGTFPTCFEHPTSLDGNKTTIFRCFLPGNASYAICITSGIYDNVLAMCDTLLARCYKLRS